MTRGEATERILAARHEKGLTFQQIAECVGRHPVWVTAALHGQATLKDGRIEQSNFHDSPVLRINETPLIETHVVKSNDPPGGLGEAGTAAIFPAVTNAIYAATGQRIRKLPVDGNLLKRD